MNTVMDFVLSGREAGLNIRQSMICHSSRLADGCIWNKDMLSIDGKLTFLQDLPGYLHDNLLIFFQ